MMGKYSETADPVSVLQINFGNGGLYGGVSSFLFNLYSNIDRSKVRFDFLTAGQTTFGTVRDEIASMGGEIFELPSEGNMLTRKIRFVRKLRRFLNDHPYRIVHINSGNFFFDLSAAYAARAAGVPVRIVHSHNAGGEGLFIKAPLIAALKPVLESIATYKAACSVKAANFMFTRRSVSKGEVLIIKNGIVPSRFAFDPALRDEVRGEMGLSDSFVIGHVGRFSEQKNHAFLLDIFDKLLKVRGNAVLLLAGEGKLREEVMRKARDMGIDENVRFLGARKDVERLYQAMDAFVMPSRFEGFPLSILEAQASGLPVVASTEITEEIDIGGRIRFLSLSDGPERWAEEVLSVSSGQRSDGSGMLSAAGCDIRDTADKMKELYRSLAR